MTDTPPGDDIAMQTRCLHCLNEQWGVLVHPISHGEQRCPWCGQYSEPMTEAEYRDALIERRKRQEMT